MHGIRLAGCTDASDPFEYRKMLALVAPTHSLGVAVTLVANHGTS